VSLFIYAPTLQTGTRELINTLEARRLVKHDGMRFLHKGKPLDFGPKDAIVCFGSHVPAIPNVATLNASYEYPNMQVIHTKGFSKIHALGNYVFMPVRLSSDTYARYMKSMPENTWWPAKQTQPHIPIPEVEGYASEYYRFTPAKVFVFKGTATGATKEAQQTALEITNKFGLDFAMVYLGLSSSSPYLLRFITGPALNVEEIKVVADHILTWYAEVAK
jgi:hypothetical protein